MSCTKVPRVRTELLLWGVNQHTCITDEPKPKILKTTIAVGTF